MARLRDFFNILKTKPEKLPVHNLWVKLIVKSRSNRIKSETKRSLVDDPTNQFDPVIKTLDFSNESGHD